MGGWEVTDEEGGSQDVGKDRLIVVRADGVEGWLTQLVEHIGLSRVVSGRMLTPPLSFSQSL